MGGIGAAIVMGTFDDILLKHQILFYFTPLIAAMAGNVGVQSSAIIVQGLVNDDIRGSVNNTLLKETFLSLLNGAILHIMLVRNSTKDTKTKNGLKNKKQYCYMTIVKLIAVGLLHGS